MASVLALAQRALAQRTRQRSARHREEEQRSNPSSAMRSLYPLFPLESSDLPKDHEECGICQETYLSGTNVETPAQLPCGHIFGMHCLRNWLNSSLRPSCPMCRADLFDQNEGKGSDVLRGSIAILERLVSSSNSSERAIVLNAAQRQTHERITEARRRAPSTHLTVQETETSLFTNRRSSETLSITAAQVLASFLALVFADLHISQPLDWGRWKLLERQIEQVRGRSMGDGSSTGTLWDHRGPGVEALLNPVLRPMVEEFLHKMVLMEKQRL